MVTPAGVLQNARGAIRETTWEIFVRRFVRRDFPRRGALFSSMPGHIATGVIYEQDEPVGYPDNVKKSQGAQA
jgi:hypothetical protein